MGFWVVVAFQVLLRLWWAFRFSRDGGQVLGGAVAVMGFWWPSDQFLCRLYSLEKGHTDASSTQQRCS